MSTLAPEPQDLAASQQMRARLRDTEAHLDQYTPAVITSADGRVYLALAATLPGQVDEEPYPFLTPQSRLPGLADLDLANLDFSNAAAIKRIEDRLNEYGSHSTTAADGQTIFARCNPAGFAGHNFQVCWIGSRREWLVLPGTAYFPRNGGAGKDQVTPRVFLQGIAGWIVLPITITPQPWQEGQPQGYVADIGRPSIVGSPSQSPPRRSISFSGTGGISGDLEEQQTYTPGSYQYPIAYVEPPGSAHKSPLIHQKVTTQLRAVFSTYWRGAFPALPQ